MSTSQPTQSLQLYLKTWCPWCQRARAFLDAGGYAYTPIDVEADPAAFQRMVALSGQPKTPTLVAGDNVLADFGPEELEAFLAEHDIQP
jgi:glutaredoxin